MSDPGEAWSADSNMSRRRGRARRTTVMLEEALDHLLHDDPAHVTEPMSVPNKMSQEEGRRNCSGASGLVIHPHYPLRQYWDSMMLVLIIFSSVYDPLQAAYLGNRGVHDYFIDCVYAIDIVLNFMTGYTVGDHSVDLSHRHIVVRYLKGWFFIDLAATFPW